MSPPFTQFAPTTPGGYHESQSPEETAMSDIMGLIQTRRSVRKYKTDPVPDEALQNVLNAVRWAQSWANTQCWEIVVIMDPTVKKEVQAGVSSGNPSYEALVSAPVLLALCAKMGTSGFYKGEAATKFGDWFMYDLGIATQNIALTAHAQGLGTVVVGLMDHDAIKNTLNVPDGYEFVTIMPLGYPDQERPAPPRRATGSFVHHETF
jgi:nitroreductase